MKNRRIINIIAFGVSGLVAVLFLAEFLGLKVFFWDQKISNILHKIADCLLMFVVFLSAFNYAFSRRNRVFLFLLVLFVTVAVVFFALTIAL